MKQRPLWCKTPTSLLPPAAQRAQPPGADPAKGREKPQLMAKQQKTCCSLPKTLPHVPKHELLYIKRVNAASAGWPLPNPQTGLSSCKPNPSPKTSCIFPKKHLPASLAPACSHTSSSSLMMFLCSPLFILSAMGLFFFNCSDRKLSSL